MSYPLLVKYATEKEYRQHFLRKYCHGHILTHDGILVRFNEIDFNHAFYESSGSIQPTKDKFSLSRAQRIDWIKKALLDKNAILKVGWNSKKKQFNQTRRVTLANRNYVVVIKFLRSGKARFITAFLADNYRTLLQIHNSPDWKSP